jgi:hypothetical protein
VFLVLVINTLFIAAIIWANKKDTTIGQRRWSVFLASALALVSAFFLVRGLDLKVVSEHEPLSVHESIVSLLHMPPAAIFLIIVLLSVVVAEFLRRAFQRANKKIHLQIEMPEGNHIVGYVFGVCGVVYAVVLAFVVVTAWQRYDHAGEVIQEEQNAVSDMSIIFERRGDEEEWLSNVRHDLRSYAYGMWAEWYIADRGELITQGKGSKLYSQSCKIRGGGDWAANISVAEEDNKQRFDKSEHWAHCLAMDLGTWKLHELRDQADYTATIAALESFTNSRAQRMRLIGEQLPAIMWASLIFGAVVLLVFTFLFSESSSLNQVVRTAALSSMIGIMFAETLVFDHPFTGSLHVPPATYDSWSDIACQLERFNRAGPEPKIKPTKDSLSKPQSESSSIFACEHQWKSDGLPPDSDPLEISSQRLQS